MIRLGIYNEYILLLVTSNKKLIMYRDLIELGKTVYYKVQKFLKGMRLYTEYI